VCCYIARRPAQAVQGEEGVELQRRALYYVVMICNGPLRRAAPPQFILVTWSLMSSSAIVANGSFKNHTCIVNFILMEFIC